MTAIYSECLDLHCIMRKLPETYFLSSRFRCTPAFLRFSVPGFLPPAAVIPLAVSAFMVSFNALVTKWSCHVIYVHIERGRQIASNISLYVYISAIQRCSTSAIHSEQTLCKKTHFHVLLRILPQILTYHIKRELPWFCCCL